MFVSGKYAVACILRGTSPDDDNNSIDNLDFDINNAEPISFNSWRIKASNEYAEITNIESLGHKQWSCGTDDYEIQLIGPHNLGELTNLIQGVRVNVFLGLVGDVESPVTDLTKPAAWMEIRCWVDDVEEVVTAEGGEDIQCNFRSDGQVSFLTEFPMDTPPNKLTGWPV